MKIQVSKIKGKDDLSEGTVWVKSSAVAGGMSHKTDSPNTPPKTCSVEVV